MHDSSAISPAIGDLRLEGARAWLESLPAWADAHLEPIAGDASFRRYFRVVGDRDQAVLMDAPPDREDTAPFLQVDAILRDAGVHAPAVLATDIDDGFLLLEDLGDRLLREELDHNSAADWFPRLFTVLRSLALEADCGSLPFYDRHRLLEELELFPRWYLERHHALTLSCEDWDIWEDLCTRLIAQAHAQPQVFVHRDFHSSNLLALPGGDIGVIDFQDAVRGPLCYDFVSLLWDRYIAWPRQRLEDWMEAFRQQVADDTEPAEWRRWCDWMGLQRNLKVVGIFARLHYRDGKDGYLEMIPRFWQYLLDVLPHYPEFEGFARLLDRLQCAP